MYPTDRFRTLSNRQGGSVITLSRRDAGTGAGKSVHDPGELI